MVKVVASLYMEENYKMKKPYIICHMMTSVDGRIDCAMTEQLPGVEDYYRTLDELDVFTTVSGRVTAEVFLKKKSLKNMVKLDIQRNVMQEDMKLF